MRRNKAKGSRCISQNSRWKGGERGYDVPYEPERTRTRRDVLHRHRRLEHDEWHLTITAMEGKHVSSFCLSSDFKGRRTYGEETSNANGRYERVQLLLRPIQNPVVNKVG